MRVFDESKTNELFKYDLEKGYLKADKLTTHVPEVPAITARQKADELTAQGKEVIEICGSLYEVISKNDVGQTVRPINETAAVPAHNEEEDIAVYILYSGTEIEKISAQLEIEELKAKLIEWDYKTSKHADGEYTDEEWNAIVVQRKAWRARINELEARYGLGGGAE